MLNDWESSEFFYGDEHAFFVNHKFRIDFAVGKKRFFITEQQINKLMVSLGKNVKELEQVSDRDEYGKVWKFRGEAVHLSLPELFTRLSYNKDDYSIFTDYVPWLNEFKKLCSNDVLYITANRFVDSTVMRRIRLKKQSRTFLRKDEVAFRKPWAAENFNADIVSRVIFYKGMNCRSGEMSKGKVHALDEFANKEELFGCAKEAYEIAKEKEARFKRFGIFNDRGMVLNRESGCLYHAPNKRDKKETLLQVLNDVEQFNAMYGGYEDFVERLDLLQTTLNKMFFFKKVEVSMWGLHFVGEGFERGFAARRLSTGEHQMVALLGLMLFDSEQNLVLSDEPETSLHPAWQRELANFFYKCKVRFNKRFIFASHSPLFIGNRSENLINLYRQVKGE